MKKLLLILTLFIAVQSFAQKSDFILVKNKERTMATWCPGTEIQFFDRDNRFIEGKITAIRNDSIFLTEYVIRQMPTQLGVYILDTSFYYYQNHYNQVKSLNKTGRRFDWASSGGALMGGGMLLTVASGISYLADSKKFSPELLGAAVALGGVGYLLSKQSGKGMQIGKRFSLQYVKASDNTK